MQKKPPVSWRRDEEHHSQGVVKLLYSRKEAAYALGISIRALDYLLSRRSIKARRIGARVLIHRDDVLKWASQDHSSSVAA
jgi:excisionase family DNA binding protein